MASQSKEAFSVCLGVLDGQCQAQLNGFKSRALRTTPPSQRHMYLTEWRSVCVTAMHLRAMLVIGDDAQYERRSLPAVGHELAVEAGGGSWAVIVMAVATKSAQHARVSLSALEVALVLVQVQVQVTTMPMSTVWLLTMGNRAHEASWGLARCARAEALLPVHCIVGAVMAALEQLEMLAEPEVMLRPQAWLVPRLARLHPSAHTTVTPAACTHVMTGGTGSLGGGAKVQVPVRRQRCRRSGVWRRGQLCACNGPRGRGGIR